MSLRSAIVAQFRQPRGLIGHLAGRIMANRPSNVQRNAWTVDLLALEPHHRVLEIGCGPGLALKACASKLTTGKAVGIDHSEVMVQQASKRVSTEIRDGRADVILGNIDDLEIVEGTFDRVFSLNVIQFIPDVEQAFRDIYAVLSEDGLAATTYQPRSKNPARADALKMAEKVANAMRHAGFVDIETHELGLEPVSAFCVTGTKPAIGQDP